MEKIKLFIRQWMMRYLRQHGWVVFYLDPKSRVCKGMCWLDLYNQDCEWKGKKEVVMRSDDPGHDAAEDILQTESDDQYGDTADADAE